MRIKINQKINSKPGLLAWLTVLHKKIKKKEKQFGRKSEELSSFCGPMGIASPAEKMKKERDSVFKPALSLFFWELSSFLYIGYGNEK